MADISEESFTRHRPVEHEGCDEAGAGQACDEGGCAPVTMRRGLDEALAPRSPAVAADHVGGRAGLVEKDEPLRVHVALPYAPVAAMLGDVRTILLGCPHLLLLARTNETAFLYA